MVNLVIFGPPGVGKGTHSQLIAQKYKLKHISSGDILRNEISHETRLGLNVVEFVRNGDLVPDKYIIDLINSIIDNSDTSGYIFDGIPRTLSQARLLISILNERGEKINSVIELIAPFNEYIKRIKHRAETSARIDDIVKETVDNRVKLFNKHRAKVVNYYKKLNLYRLVKADGSKEETFSRLCSHIDNILNITKR
jgi:adenylate kinase